MPGFRKGNNGNWLLNFSLGIGNLCLYQEGWKHWSEIDEMAGLKELMVKASISVSYGYFYRDKNKYRRQTEAMK